MRARLLPLAAWLAAVLAVWWLVHRSLGPRFDAEILVATGAVFGLVALVMVLGSRAWSARALGSLGAFAAIAGFFGRWGAARLGWTGPLTPVELDLIRALLIVSAPALLYGVVRWAWRTRLGTRADDGSPSLAWRAWRRCRRRARTNADRDEVK